MSEQDAAEAAAERRLELLRRLEWASARRWTTGAGFCPACHNHRDHGHQRDGHVGIGPDRIPCWLDAELNPPTPPPS